MADSKYSDACYLADYIDIFSKKIHDSNKRGYSGFKCVSADKESGGGAHEIISKLTSRNGKSVFLDLEPAAMALLIPKVRLYKLIYDGKRLVGQKEFIFEDFYSRKSVDAIFGGVTGAPIRIGGKGLSEVSWALKGTNPAEAEKVINVNMKFEFQGASDLLGNRYDPSDGSIVSGNPELDQQANMIDLILHPPQLDEAANSRSGESEYKPSFYRIKMVVGWARPQLQNNRLPGLSAMETRDLLAELSNQRMSLILNLVSHEFDIQENGQIALGVEYIGSLEESINGNDADVLRVDAKVQAMDPITMAEKKDTERKIADLSEYVECLRIGEASEDKIKDAEEAIQGLEEDNQDIQADIDELSAEIKGEVYQKFLTSLQDHVMEMELDEGGVEEWVESLESAIRPPFGESADGTPDGGSTPDNAEDGEDAIDEVSDAAASGEEGATDAASEMADKAREEAQDPAKGYIHYIALGHIISSAVKAGMGPKNMEVSDSIVLTGPVVVNHPRGGRFHMNLADIPIPYQDFQAFFFETVVRKQLASYPLKQFIKDLMEKLVKKVLQPPECFQKGRAKRVINISMNNFTISEQTAEAAEMSYANVVLNPKPSGRFNASSTSLPPLPLDNGEPENDLNCMLFYMNNYKAEDLKGHPYGEGGSYDDSAKGIYHFYIGAEGGLVKSIDFTRTDVQGLREARQAESRNLGQIRDVYDAKVTLFGNQMFYPGMKIFLNPPIGFGKPQADGYGDNSNFGSLANLLGIGGYYDVITVESTITQSGQYETTLDCKFAQSGGTADSVAGKCNGIVQSVQAEHQGAWYNPFSLL